MDERQEVELLGSCWEAKAFLTWVPGRQGPVFSH